MPRFVKARSFLRNLFLTRRVEMDLDQEVHSHLEMLTEENIRGGMSPQEAQRAARIELGGIEQVKEQVRDERIGNWLQSVLSDCRYGLRQLRKNPGFTAVAILTLALGIGVNIAMFSVADALALRPLDVKDADRVIRMWNRKVSGAYAADPGFSWPEFEAFRTGSRSLSGIAASDRRGVLLRHGEETRQLLANVVSPNYFDVFGVKPALGRLFVAGEFQAPDVPHPIVFSFDFWQREYNGDPQIVGKTVIANQLECMVVGILPRTYRGTEAFLNPDVYVPLPAWYAMNSSERKHYEAEYVREFELLGKLQPGVSPVQAQVELAAIQKRLNDQLPKADPDRLVTVQLDLDEKKQGLGVAALLLLCITGLVLLVACANVTNLLLARAETRRTEIATRLAIGASRFRLVRQLLTETLVLACIAGAFAYLLADWIIHLLPSLMPPMFGLDFRMDSRTAAFAVTASMMTVFIAGIVPALGSMRTSIAATAKEHASSGRRTGRLKNVLVVAEVAISAMLLIAAGLLIRTLIAVRSQDLGFDQARKMLIVTFDTSGHTPDQYHAFLLQVLERLPATPGVESVAFAGRIPMWESGGGAYKLVWVPGLNAGPGEDGVRVNYTVVSPGYFSTIGTRIVHGRSIDGRDKQTSGLVAVINEKCARSLWPGQDPIGQHFRIGGSRGKDVEVVGIAQDGHYNQAIEDPRSYMFLPMSQDPHGDAVLLISTKLDPRSLAGSVRYQLRSIDPNVRVLATTTLQEHMRFALFANRILVKLVTSVGVLALILAAIGLYGVISYSVSRTTHEIGVRMALGAAPADILWSVIAHGGSLALTGVVLGLLAAVAMRSVIASVLFGVSPADPLTFVVVAVVLLSVTLVACYVPARRAMRVDPMVALRYE
jgi:predicted permease